VGGLLACTRGGDVGVYLDNFTFPLTLCHTSFEFRAGCLLFVLLLGGVSIVNFLSLREESGLQCTRARVVTSNRSFGIDILAQARE
jgi:hypothetical protein